MGSEQTDAASTSTATIPKSASATGAGRDQKYTGGTETSEVAALDARTSFQIECLKNARYHEDREIFFARLHKMTMLIAVLGGTATFAFVSQFKLFAALIAVAGVVDLVFDVSGKARLHAALRRRVYDVMAQAENPTRELFELREQAARIYADEPPCMHAVNALAYNAAMQAFDRPARYQFPVSGLHRALRHWWPFTAEDFKTHEEIAKQELI